MRLSLFFLVAVLACLAAPEVHAVDPFGAEEYRGTITSTDVTSRNNSTTTHADGSFTIRPGVTYAIYCDQDVRYRFTDADDTGATSKSYPIPKNTGFIVVAPRALNATRLWTISQGTGVTSNCAVYEKLE